MNHDFVYLYAAVALLLAGLFGYLVVLARRQATLRADVEALRRLLEGRRGKPPA